MHPIRAGSCPASGLGPEGGAEAPRSRVAGMCASSHVPGDRRVHHPPAEPVNL